MELYDGYLGWRVVGTRRAQLCNSISRETSQGRNKSKKFVSRMTSYPCEALASDYNAASRAWILRHGKVDCCFYSSRSDFSGICSGDISSVEDQRSRIQELGTR